MFISPAYAQAAGGGGGSGLEMFLPLILIFVVFWVLLIRPQQKKMKEHRAMVDALRRGDKVVTAGGIIGTVTKVTEGEPEIQVEISEGVKVKVVRGTIGAGPMSLQLSPEPSSSAKLFSKPRAAGHCAGSMPRCHLPEKAVK